MVFYKKLLFITGILLSVIFASDVRSQTFEKFRAPDASSRVITYWMWLNGHISKEGITKDLEAMKSAGVNGTYMFSVGMYQPGPVKFLSDQWWDCVGHAIKESDRLKMSFGIYNSDGWSMSGGPWITPEESMKQVVWADTLVEGGRHVKFRLPKTPVNLIYHDIAVLAFPALQNEAPLKIDRITSSNLVTDAEAMIDHRKIIRFLTPRNDQYAFVVLDFGRQHDLRRVVFDEVVNNPSLEASAKLEYSNDGVHFTLIKDSFPLNLKAESLVKQFTFSFSKVTARYIRLSIGLEPASKKPVPLSQDDIAFGKIAFYESPRVYLWEPKSGESKRIRHERQQLFMKELNSPVHETLPGGSLVNTAKMINLTAQVDETGILSWQAPKGKWTIQRIGYTSTNRMVGPATKEGKGLECNKMDSKAVAKHFNSYAGRIIDLSQKLIGKPVDHMQMESWEAGIQNWTGGFEKEFMARNGYSIIPYLPVLAGGYVVNSYEESDQFLWDFRNTVAQSIAENYWGTMYKLAKAKGVTVSGEGSGMQHYLYDPMRYQKFLDIPMGEFWPNEVHVRADVKNASSVAHTYGHNLAGAEAFTSGDENLWSVTPFDLKQIGDEAFTSGVNNFVLHTYVHQPYDIAPGFTLTKFGNHLQRLNPWYSHAQGWFDYFARCQYMLRQGKNIQDIAYFTGEGIPAYLGLPWELHPELPSGYDYDGVNTEVIKQMTVKNGKMYLPSGACYSLLVFQDITLMTPELVREIRRLVAAGANIVSAKPTGSPSLADRSNASTVIRKIADEVWGNMDGKKYIENHDGKGGISYGIALNDLLKRLNLVPDFTYTSDTGTAKINFVHKQTDSSDNYFLVNYVKHAVQVNAVFRVTNKVPALWDADKGTAIALPFEQLSDKRIAVTLRFDPLGSMFVVFKNAADNKMQPAAALQEFKSIPITASWNVRFVSSRDSFTTVLDRLIDWSVSDNAAIKFFSGTAVYSQDIIITDSAKKVELQLGELNNNMAHIIINGQPVASLWKPPYHADITALVRPGKNHLVIEVSNTAVNSLIGDERFAPDLTYSKNSNIASFPPWLQHPETRGSQRKTFVTFKYISRDSELDPSGLVGPVQIKLFH